MAAAFVLSAKEEPKQERRLGKAPVSAGDARVALSMGDPTSRMVRERAGMGERSCLWLRSGPWDACVRQLSS